MFKRLKAKRELRLRKKVVLALINNQKYNEVFYIVSDANHIIHYIKNGYVPMPKHSLEHKETPPEG